MDPVQTANVAGQAVGDLSMWGLFMQADIIVKTVMAALVMSIFLLPTLYVWVAGEGDILPDKADAD